MARICKGLKKDEEDLFFGKDIIDSFCEAKGDLITLNIDTEEHFDRLKEKLKIVFKTQNGDSMPLENIFFKSKQLEENFEYNFAIVQSSNSLNQLGVAFLEDRIIKIDNSKAKIEILKKPSSKVFLLSQRIVVSRTRV